MWLVSLLKTQLTAVDQKNLLSLGRIETLPLPDNELPGYRSSVTPSLKTGRKAALAQAILVYDFALPVAFFVLPGGLRAQAWAAWLGVPP